jgi:hypothetical protein
MDADSRPPNGRRVPSKVLAEVRKNRHTRRDLRTAGERMEAAFELSLEARAWFRSGLKSRGFSDSESAAIFRARRK